MRQDEQAVQNLIFCMDGFNTVPFDENASELRSGQFGVIALLKVLEDLQNDLEEREQSNDILKKLVLFIKLSLKARLKNALAMVID